MERNRGGRPRHPDVLTPAEWRVLEALREGGTNAEIGARLGISADAVKYHISNMLGKLELRDRRALAAWRPEERRGRLPAWFAVPAAIGAIARPVAWVGIGTAAAAGVAATAVAAVVAVAVLLVVVGGDGEPPTVVRATLPTPDATSTAALAATVSPTPTPPATPTATPSPPPTVTPAPQQEAASATAATPTGTPAPEPCNSIECLVVNPCHGLQCMEADPPRSSCQGYNCIESVPNAFERRIFEPGEHIDWEEGVFFLDVASGRMDAYRIQGAHDDSHSSSYDGAWVVVWSSGLRQNWDLMLHRESGQAWRWAEGTQERLFAFLREELQLDYPECVTYPEPRAPLGQADGVPCDEPRLETAANTTECQGRISPDGRYVAQQWGQPLSIKYREYARPLVVTPSVVIADAGTCAPLFRIGGAYAYRQFWEGQWLSDGAGFVVGVTDGHVVARINPPELVYLPRAPLVRDPGIPWGPSPVPAPTGDGRYFAYDFAGVYDAGTDRWVRTGFHGAHWGPFSWGTTHGEMRYQLAYWGEGRVNWDLSEPRIEFPPFAEMAFRVTGTGSCLNLRDAPSSMAPVLDCLPDDTRVIATMPPLDEASCLRFGIGTCLPMTRVEFGSDGVLEWVYVRTKSDVEGWVAHSVFAAFDEPLTLYLQAEQAGERDPVVE